jgi:hypothetical protein
MSKLARDIRIDALRLYRKILKLHVVKLSEDMRMFGDFFVKSEFTLNYKQADEELMNIFIKQWKDYAETLEKNKNVKEIASVKEDLKTKMDLDQKKIFNDLKETIEKKL